MTHAKRLYEPEAWLPRLTTAWHELGDRRAVLLVQLHPAHSRDDVRLEYFLSRLPPWMRVAVEFRHGSWHDEAVYALLERHGAAYCVMSGARLPCVLRATASFVYVRMHGPDAASLYAGSYGDADVRWWVDRLRPGRLRVLRQRRTRTRRPQRGTAARPGGGVRRGTAQPGGRSRRPWWTPGRTGR